MLVTFVLALALAGCRVTTPEPATVAPQVKVATVTLPPTDTLVATVTPSLPTLTPTLSPTPTPTTSPTATQMTTPPSLSPQERTILETIADEVKQMRGLDSDVPLALAFMTPEALHEWLIEQLAKGYSPQEARRDALVYAVLELLPPDTDLYALTLALYTEQIIGFYDDELDQMTIIDDKTGLDALDKITFAHEYVHDLQDQFLDLDELQTYRETAGNEDAVRAVAALVEGDAQMVTLLYLFDHLGELDLSDLGAIQTSELDAAPPVLQEEMLFPHMAGLTFVQAIHQQGGWDAVNAAYDALPQSTEQILHPEKYLAGEAPIAVSLPPLTSTLGADWRLVTENTLGEFLLNLYLDAHLPGEAAQDASAGWGGDRFALYEQPATGNTLLLVVTTWDSKAEAAEFASAYETFAGDRYGAPAIAKDAMGAWWQGENDATLLSASDGTVISVIVGPQMDVIRRVWPPVERELRVEG